MSWIFRIASLVRSSENIRTTLRTASSVIRKIKTSAAAMETAAVQELIAKAEQGDASAQFDCGEQYFFGHSVPQDYAEAARWFRLAAEQGHAQAQANLGLMFAAGRGLPKDPIEAFAWISLAVARRNESAVKAQRTLMKRMSAEQIAEAQRRAASVSVSPT